MRSHQRKTFFALVIGFVLLCTPGVQAQTSVTSRFQVLIDADRNATTGCSVTTNAGRFDGAEMIVTTTVVTTGQTSRVTSVARQTCSDPATATFSAPQTFDTTGWPVALGDNAMTVESHLPLQFLPDSNAVVRLGFIISTDSSSNSIFSLPSGDPILFPPHGGRRRAVTAPGGERTILLDGAIEDWVGISPILSMTGTNSFLGIRMFDLGDQLYFRIDVSTGAGNPGLPAPPFTLQPVALDDAYDVVQGHSIHVNAPGVLGNDTDPLDPTKANLKANLTKPASHGNLTLNPDGSFTYFHDASAPAPDTFGYRATNGAASSGNATVTLNVNPSHAPLAIPHTYNVAHGGTLTIAPPGVLQGAVDQDGDPIRSTISVQPQHGTVTLQTNGSFVYTHDGSNTLADSFGFKASDGISTASTTTVTIIVGPNAPPVAVNDPAAANVAAYTVAEGGTLNVAAAVGILANDTDPDTPKSAWGITVVTQPAHGTLNVAADGSFVYVHDGSETTADSFTYRVTDGIALSNIATVALTITPVNDAPVAVNDSYPAVEDQPLNIAAPGVKSNDSDADVPAQTLTATVVTNPANGTVALNPNGGFLYTPNANFNGVDSFTYKLNDGVVDSNVATVTITVAPVNDAPSYSNSGNVNVLEDAGAQSINWASSISAGPADEAGQALNFVIVNNSNAGLFSVQPSISPAGVLTFTPAANANGTATITVHLHDNGGTANGGVDTSADVTFDIVVAAVNDVPSFTKGADQTVLEDAGAQTVNGWATSLSKGPADEASQTLNFLVSNNNNALFAVQPSIDASGNLTYTPAANAFGAATVSVQIHDDGGTANGGVDTSAIQTFTITVTGVNDVPSFTKGADQTVLEDSGAHTVNGWATALSAGPNEGSQALNFIVSNNNNGLFSAQPAVDASGNLTFTSAPNANGTATVSVQVHDNGGTANGGVDTSAVQTFVINVTAVNDAPSFAKGADQSVSEDTGLHTVNGWATSLSAGPADEAGQTLSFLVSNDNNALFSVQPAVDASGNLTYTLAADANGVANVSVQIQDNGGTANGGIDTSAAQTFVITVAGVNDAPVNNVPAGQSVAEDSSLIFSAGNSNAITVSDIDAGSGQVKVTLTVANGIVTLGSTAGVVANGNGTANVDVTGTIANVNAALSGLQFVPTPDFNGAASIGVLTDDQGNSGSGGPLTANSTINITVTAVNDAPTLTLPGAQSAFEDTNLTFSTGNSNAISVGDIDAGSGIVSLNLTSANGTITIGSLAGLNSNSGNGTGNVTITGTVTALNASLQGTVFTPSANFSGSTTIDLTVDDNGNTGAGGALQATGSITVNVTAINDAPSFTKGADQTVLEDAGAQTVNGWATAISAGPGEGTQTVNFLVSNNNNALFSVQPAVDASGNLTYTPAANANGSATVTIAIHDGGGTANGGVDTSANQTFVINVTAVNDAPSFMKGADQSVLEDTGLHTVNGWATGLSAGPADESGQTLNFIVSNNNNALFSVQPAADASGNLTYTLAADAFGSATVSVQIHDNGGTANGGVDTSAVQTFTITVTNVNDAPSFTKGADQTVLEDAAPVTVNGWATALSAGPNEGSQTLNFIVSNNNNALFSVQPAVDASGNLTYTLAANANGTATVSVQIHDNGGTANGGVDTSAVQTFAINVTAVNDVPSFTKGADQTALEDSGAQTVNGWATGLSAGPADESGQTLNFIVSNNNNALFSVQPAVSASGNLTYTPASNAFGTATVSVQIHDNGGTANGGVDTSAIQTFTITITNVNDAPSFTKGADQTVLEDAAAQTVNGWATGISAGPGEATQNVNFIVSNNNNTLFSVQPAVDASGNLTYTLATNANGSATVSVQIHDDGGTANGGVDTSAVQTFSINVTAVNDAPSFTKGADQTVLEDSGAATVNGWATALSAGPPDESGQTLNFIVSNNNNALFSVQPAVDASGNLTFTPAANAFGTATVSVQIHDNGGTANGGVDTSAIQTFLINVTGVNDAPSFTKGADQTVLEDAAAQTVNGWATGISAGPNEGGQTVNFIVSNNNNALFSVQPAVDASGNLTYTLAANANGTALVSVQIHDNGGTANGGVDTSAVQTFNINVTAVNDAPSFTKGADQTVLEDSGAATVNGWATALSAGPADESGQTLNFIVSNNNNALFAVQPAISAAGNLTFTPASNAFGTATVSVQIHDNGGTANGGVDTSAVQTFLINVTGVNDAPSFTKGADQNVLEDAAPVTVSNWATAISAGPGESGQNVTFLVSNNNNSLFSVQPAVSSTGTLTYALAANANGTALVTVSLQDDGGTANGGVDTSAAQTFNINVTAVNDAPSFTFAAGHVYVLADSGTNILPNWVQNRSKGPADESGQTLTGHMTNDNNALFTSQPVVDMSNGWVSFDVAPGATGTATVSLFVTDNGGTANGGNDTSPTLTFTLTVEAAPSVTSTSPINGGTIARSTPITFNFSEPVNATTASFTVTCGSTAQVFTINASPASSFTLTPDVSQGSLWTAGNCTATALAAQVTDVDTDDPPNGMAANYSFTFVTNTPPVANPDTFSAIGNVTVTIPAGTGLLANDSDPDSGQTLSATAGTFTTTGGGSITIAADGSFTYHTAANANSGTDTYTYTLNDGVGGTATALITFNISGRYIYVQHDAAAGGDGRDVTPYQTITAAEAVAAANDTILVLTGGAGALDEGATLKSGQVLLGQGITTALTTTLNTQTVTLLATGSSGLLSRSTAGAALTLNSGNTVKGLTITASNGTAMTGTTFGTLTTDNLSLTATTGTALSLTTGSFAAGSIINNVTATGGTNGVLLSAVGGSVTFSAGSLTNATSSNFAVVGGTVAATYSGNITQNAGAGSLVSVTGAHTTGTLTFQTGTLSATAGTGLQLTSANGNYNFNGTTTLNGGGAQVNVGGTGSFVFASGTTVTSPAAAAFAATGAPNVTFSGSLSQSTANALVSISAQTGGTITFDTGTLTASNGTGIVLANADGAVNFNGNTSLSTSAGVAVTTGSSGTITFSSGATHSINSTSTGFNVDSSSPTVTYPGSITVNGARAVLVNALAGGTVTLSGNISNGTAGTPNGLGIVVTNGTGGTINFSGASKSLFTGASPAVTLNTNAAATNINFTNGGLAITTTTGTGLSGATAGTLTVSGSGNTISSTGTGVNLNGATIPAGNVTFQSINAGGTNGIALATIGGAGSFIVTGTGSAGSGGTITATGAAVSLTSTSATSLTNMALTGVGGISGTTFGTLTASGVSVNGTTGSAFALNGGTIASGSTFSSVSASIPAASVIAGATFTGVAGGFTVSGGTITGGNAAALNVAGSSFTATWQGSISQANNAALVNVVNNGVTNDTSSLTFNTGSLTATGGTGLQFAHGNGSYSFNGTTTLNGGDAGVDITTSSTGTYVFGTGVAITNPTGTAFNVNTSTPGVTYSGNITKNGTSAGLAVDLNTVASGTITFQTGTITNSSTAGTGISLTNVDGTVNFNGTTTLSAGNNGVDVSGGSGGTVTFASGTSITNPSAELISIQSSAVNLTYSGTMSKTNAGRAIFISNETGGAILFNNGAAGAKNIKPTSGKGIELASNTGATIDFTGGNLDITSSSATAFDASGGGTITVTGTGNKIVATSGSGLSVSGVTIGSNDLTFEKISSSSGGNGIYLNNTGAVGGLTVTGTGTAGSGGVITSSTGADAAGITPTATENAGSGVFLFSTRDVSLTRMQINDAQNFAIYGNSVTNFTLANSVISGSNGNNDLRDEGSIAFDNLLGTASITNSSVSGGWEDNLRLRNTSGTLNRLTIDTVNWGSNSATFGNAALNMQVTGGTMNVTVNNCTFTGSRSHFIQYLLNGGGTPAGDFVFTNNNISQSMAAISGAGGIFVSSGGNGNPSFTYNIDTNTITGSVGNGINVSKGAGTGTFSGTINNNTIGTSGVANSGSSQGNGLAIIHVGGGTHTTHITNNKIRRYNNDGILIQVGDNTSGGNGTVNLTLTGNLVKEPDSFALHGVELNIGTTAGDTHFLCATVGGAGTLKNDISGSGNSGNGGGNGGFELRPRQRQSTTIRLPGYGGAATDTTAVGTFLAGQNTTSGTAFISASAASNGFVNGAACP